MSRRVVLCLPPGTPFADPGPAETARRGVSLGPEWDGTAAGVVGWAEGCRAAVEVAAVHADDVERLVLVSVPGRDVPDARPSAATKTLVLHGSRDPAGGNALATAWRDLLGARVEMVPGGGRDILEHVWPRVLSFLAPRSARRRGD